jgi:hypothetical protein
VPLLSSGSRGTVAACKVTRSSRPYDRCHGRRAGAGDSWRCAQPGQAGRRGSGAGRGARGAGRGARGAGRGARSAGHLSPISALILSKRARVESCGARGAPLRPHGLMNKTSETAAESPFAEGSAPALRARSRGARVAERGRPEGRRRGRLPRGGRAGRTRPTRSGGGRPWPGRRRGIWRGGRGKRGAAPPVRGEGRGVST